MKETYFLNFFKINSIFLLLLIFVYSSNQLCSIELFNYIHYKLSCEAEDGVSTSCYGTPFPVHKVKIQCSPYYHKTTNIDTFSYYCGYSTDKSHILNAISCQPECEDNFLPFTRSDTQTKYPSWYAEILELSSDKTITKIYQGVIFHERMVYTAKGPLKDSSNSYALRIPRSENNVIDPSYYFNDITLTDWKLTMYNTTYDHYTIFTLPSTQFIRFNENIKPICDQTYPQGTNNKQKVLKGHLKNYGSHLKLRPPREQCFIPQIDDTKMEMVCLKKNNLPTTCTASVDRIVVRCKLGLKHKNTKADWLYTCNDLNLWENSTNDATCEFFCGKIDETFSLTHVPFVYKGSETEKHSAPWHVAIYFNNPQVSKFEQICGGTIIHNNIVVSAAHCFYNKITDKVDDPSKYLIGAGKIYRNYETREDSEHYANINEIRVPGNYDPYQNQNDIAVLILDHLIEYSSLIRPVCLDDSQIYYRSSTIPGGLEGRIVGWGATSESDSSSYKLSEANLGTISNIECQTIVGPYNKALITNDKFCAISAKSSTACQGDSGGGYVVKTTVLNKERYYLLGIISSGINPTGKFCFDGTTTLFTNIQHYLDFIRNATLDARNSYFLKL